MGSNPSTELSLEIKLQNEVMMWGGKETLGGRGAVRWQRKEKRFSGRGASVENPWENRLSGRGEIREEPYETIRGPLPRS